MLTGPDLWPVATQFTFGVDEFHSVDNLSAGVTLVSTGVIVLTHGTCALREPVCKEPARDECN
ncbi:hypothetical protein DPMN_177490 [Dreissena polymorpha]|uniref:Uncharacterized protein n=1 Tax=Dreissena polymorpha TaxID=45954 RepID=A0A9D4IKL1_DREPO|nr:hypothetical protein DPMN_177490 [Dreissena polymorpha]